MGPKKKKITKKERQRLADEVERHKRQQMEQERLRLLREEKERIEREKKLAQEKIKREVAEQEIRHRELMTSCQLFHSLRQQKREREKATRKLQEWTQYLKCDGLPDPNSFSQMNTYLYLWKKEECQPEIQKVLDKTEEVLDLLNALDELIIDPPYNALQSHVDEWKKIRNDLRSEQQKRLDLASHALLRNIDKNLEPLDLTTSRFTLESRHFILNLWNVTMPPISVSGANEPKHPFNLDFANIGVSMLLPATFARVNLAVRALWLKYDHISDGCRTWECPPVPDTFHKDLEQVTMNEWRIKTDLQKRLDEYEENIESATAEELLINKPKKTIAESMAEMEENQLKHWRDRMTIESVPHEVNLRKFTFLGGVFYLDLLEQPPQPRQLDGKRVVTLPVNTPEGLNPIPYYEHYVPPPPPEPGARRTPEEIEVEVKKQEQALEKLASVTVAEEAEKPKMPAEDLKREMEKEKELQKLVVLTVDLPENVLWFEQPMAANWDPDNNYWSTEEIHDLKFNEDKQTLTFRSGRMGLIGLACYRYCNFPYQTWEMKPESKSSEAGVLLNITAAVAIIEFLIRDDKVALNLLQNGTTNALQEHVGVFYKPKNLIKILQEGGVDIFPPPDVFCYLEGVVVKHRVAEDHLYHCMSVMSTSHNFSWSRWNMMAGRRNMVLQMREFADKKRLPNYNILHVTPLKACLVDCTEVSANFNEEGIQGMKFYPDLYNLAMNHSSNQAKEKIQQIPFNLSETVCEMLCALRPLCFS